MLYRSHKTAMIQTQIRNEPLWSQEESIQFECAKEVISDLMGICSGKIAEENSKLNPDAEKIKLLKAERSALFKERAQLYLKNKTGIEWINLEYGKKVRAHRVRN